MKQINEIQERLEKITPGPWTFSDSSDVSGDKGEFRACSPYNGFMLVRAWCNDGDIDFIAHAPTDMACLLALVEEKDKRIAELLKDLEKCGGCWACIHHEGFYCKLSGCCGGGNREIKESQWQWRGTLEEE